MSNQEQERLRRIREQQLQARDPLAKQKKFQQHTSKKVKRMQKSFSLAGAWKDIPHVIKSPFYGLVAGVLLLVILPRVWENPNATLVAGVATAIFVVFGLTLGNALDIRDEMRDNVK